MSPLPAIGTRWGDLTPEQRASLPVGTVLDLWPDRPKLVRTATGWAYADGKPAYTDAAVNPSREILSYPEPT